MNPLHRPAKPAARRLPKTRSALARPGRGRMLALCFALALLHVSRAAEPTRPPTSTDAEEQAYLRALADRCRNILLPLRLDSLAVSNRVHNLLMEQYQTLRRIHAERDRALDELNTRKTLSPDQQQQQREQILQQTRAELQWAHQQFLERLGAELTPEQVDHIKDGMTYNLATVTYNAYLRLLPELTEDQKRHIHSLLLEAREQAMDEGSAREKHALFNRYKGRINNYLSAQGYDLKAAERRLRESISAQRKAERSSTAD